VFRSTKHIYAQIIDDNKGQTLVSVSEKDVDVSLKGVKIAAAVGQKIAEKALTKKINKVIFDRSGYKYHGRVKALADGARKAGLSF